MMKKHASIIVTCKGRLSHLKRSLHTMLSQDFPFSYEVIVVDYGCPDGTFNWCQELDLARLVAVCVEDNVDEFNVSRARNCGAIQAKGSILGFVDADILLHRDWLHTVARRVVTSGIGLMRCQLEARNGWDRGGTCALTAQMFHEVRGYDESFRGWGGEDIDFYERCKALAPVAKFSPSLLHPIRHTECDRVRFYAVKSITTSAEANVANHRRSRGQVNPDGYGLGVTITHVGTTVLASDGNRHSSLPSRIRNPLRRGS